MNAAVIQQAEQMPARRVLVIVGTAVAATTAAMDVTVTKVRVMDKVAGDSVRSRRRHGKPNKAPRAAAATATASNFAAQCRSG